MSGRVKRSEQCSRCKFYRRHYRRVCALCDLVVCDRCTTTGMGETAECCGSRFCYACATCAICSGPKQIRQHRCRRPGRIKCWSCEKAGCAVCIDLSCKTQICTARLCDACVIYCGCGCKTVRCRFCVLPSGVSRECALGHLVIDDLSSSTTSSSAEEPDSPSSEKSAEQQNEQEQQQNVVTDSQK